MSLVRRSVGVLGELLLTLGALVLLFVVWQLWWTDVVAGAEQEQSVVAFERSVAGAEPTDDRASAADPLIEGDVFGVIRIPRFGDDYARPVLEGTGLEILSQGVGHYSGTALPGELGNFAVAGHRTTWAKPFNLIHTPMTSCHPMYGASERYIVHARLEDTFTRAEGLPPHTLDPPTEA